MMPADPNNKPLAHPRQNSLPDTSLPGPLSLASIAPPGPPLPALPQQPPGLSATPTVGALLLALKRRWPLAVPLACVGAVLGVLAVYVVMPPKYTVQTRLKLQPQAGRPVVSDGFNEPDTDPAIFRASQQAVIKSSAVLNNALNSDRLKGLAIAGQSPRSLETAIKVDFTLGPDIMQVKLSGDEPEHLADVLQAKEVCKSSAGNLTRLG